MGFPTPKGHGESDTETKPRADDNLSEHKLKSAIREYADWCIRHYEAFEELDLSDVEIQISHQFKRAAGKAGGKINGRSGKVSDLRMKFSWKAYQKWGWNEDFRNVIRHELVHIWQYQQRGSGDHGYEFRMMAEKVDAPRHCPKFAEFKYELSCSECGEFAGGRHKRSKTVKFPHRYRSNCCGAELQSERV